MKYLIITFAQELPDGRIFRHHKRTYNVGSTDRDRGAYENAEYNDALSDESDWLKVPGHFVIKQRSN